MSVRSHIPGSAPTLPESITFSDVFGLAWPIIISMLSFTVMSVVDTLFVARLDDGTEPVAGVGLAAVAVFTVHGFGNGVLQGCKIAVAQTVGEGVMPRAKRLLWQALYLAVLMGFVEASLALVSTDLFAILPGSDAARGYAGDYFGVRVLGGPVAFAMYAMSAYLQGRGETRLPMVATLLSNATNIALDPILIFGWGPIEPMGVSGAALATVIAFTVGSLFLARRVSREVRGTSRAVDRQLLGWIWRVGMPLGVRASLEIGSFFLFSLMLAAVGDVHLAAHIMVVRIISVSFLPGYGISEATSILVGQALGAGRDELVSQIRRAALHIALGMMTACGLLFLFLPDPLMAIFDAKPAVAELGATLLIAAAAFQIFDAVALVAQGVLNGAGDTRFVMWSSVATSWVVKLPLGYALADAAGLGALGAWLGLTAEIMVIAAISAWRVRSGRWRGMVRMPATAEA